MNIEAIYLGVPIAFDCQRNEFTCNQSRVFGINDCIEARYRCDGQLDCDDDSDEKGCGMFCVVLKGNHQMNEKR